MLVDTRQTGKGKDELEFEEGQAKNPSQTGIRCGLDNNAVEHRLLHPFLQDAADRKFLSLGEKPLAINIETEIIGGYALEFDLTRFS